MTNALNTEWERFLQESAPPDDSAATCEIKRTENIVSPLPSELYISTTTRLAYLQTPVDMSVFWNIDVISYASPKEGVVKKQIKITSTSPDELASVQHALSKYYPTALIHEQVLSHVDNVHGRVKFLDIRKITIGTSKKHMMSHRCTVKKAFDNCFVLIVRIYLDPEYREFHVKIFNTGKIEVPGIQTEAAFQAVLKFVKCILQPYMPDELQYSAVKDTVIINSNFHCNFYIDREALVRRLTAHHGIPCMYDPCAYPGVKCKFYYDPLLGDIQTGKQPDRATGDIGARRRVKLHDGEPFAVSCMMFRTGNVLIVGRCEEDAIRRVYAAMVRILRMEFPNVRQSGDEIEKIPRKSAPKIRCKTAYFADVKAVTVGGTSLLDEPPTEIGAETDSELKPL